jgi:hypothetical protein
MSALGGGFNRSTQHLLILLERRCAMEGTARIWFTPRQRAELWERWKNVNVWRISLGRLRGGARAVSIVSWLSMVALLRGRAGELRER